MQFERWFKIVGGQALPVSGPVDGVKCLLLQDAANQFGVSKQTLEELYDAFIVSGGLLPPGDPDHPDAEKSDAESLEDATQDREWTAAIESAVTSWRSDPRKVVLRHSEFGHLSDQQLACFLALARGRGLDPWADQAYPTVRWNSAKKRECVEVGLPLKTLSGIAHKSGAYGGIDAPIFKTSPDGLVLEASITVYRVVGGVRCPFVGTARIEDYSTSDPDSIKSTMPYTCMAAAAERAALRKAFAPEIGDQSPPPGPVRPLRRPTSPVDGRPVPNPPAPPSSGPGRPAADFDSQVDGFADGEGMTSMSFHRALMEMELDSQARNALVAEFRRKMPGQLEAFPGVFYKAVLDQVRAHPGRWGATAV